jgi:hypothetical protein
MGSIMVHNLFARPGAEVVPSVIPDIAQNVLAVFESDAIDEILVIAGDVLVESFDTALVVEGAEQLHTKPERILSMGGALRCIFMESSLEKSFLV